MQLVDKEGWIRKRGGRMHRWSHRYFILSGHQIIYKLKPDASVRGTFDLTSGCALTDIVKDSKNGRGKKTFSFWIVWPYDKNLKPEPDKDEKEEYSDGEDENSQSRTTKDLKKVCDTFILDYEIPLVSMYLSNGII